MGCHSLKAPAHAPWPVHVVPTYGSPCEAAVLGPKPWPRRRAPWVVHGPFPRRRLSCPSGPRCHGLIRRAWSHAAFSRSALIRPAWPFAGAPGEPRVLPALPRYPRVHAVSLTPAGRFGAVPSLPESYPSSPERPRLDPFISPVSQIWRGFVFDAADLTSGYGLDVG